MMGDAARGWSGLERRLASFVVANLRRLGRAGPAVVQLRLLRPSARTYRQRFRRMNLEQWLVYHQQHIVFSRCSWMGVRTVKNPLDAWIYQELLYEVRPDVVIEIGSAYGGSTLYFAHLLDLLGGGIVISIDIDRSSYGVEHPRIVPLTGSSSSPEVLAEVATLCARKSALVIHDGDHHAAQVLHDLRSYAPFVSPGSYFIVEDGIVDLFKSAVMSWSWADGPLAAVEQFLQENPYFVVDRTRERYLLTYNPSGFLKRIA